MVFEKQVTFPELCFRKIGRSAVRGADCVWGRGRLRAERAAKSLAVV